MAMLVMSGGELKKVGSELGGCELDWEQNLHHSVDSKLVLVRPMDSIIYPTNNEGLLSHHTTAYN